MRKRAADPFSWLIANRDRPGLKCLVGLRTGNKRRALSTFVDLLRQEGTPDCNLFWLDFEAPRFRSICTAEQILQHISAAEPRPGMRYLFLIEPTARAHSGRIISDLLKQPDLNIFAACSNNQLVMVESERNPDFPRTLRTVYPPSYSDFPRERLDSIWNTILIRDVLNREKLADVRAIEAITEIISDNLGLPLSFRQIGAAVQLLCGRALSASTIGDYTTSLCDSYLVSRVPTYDLFDGNERGTKTIYYYTSTILRHARFGTPTDADYQYRLLKNEVFIELLRRYPKVWQGDYNGAQFDFVVRDRGNPIVIMVAPDLAGDIPDKVLAPFSRIPAGMNIEKLLLGFTPPAALPPQVEFLSLTEFLV